MLRNILLFLLLAAFTPAMAQKTKSAPSKTTEKKNDPNVDYKQVGAPMPSLIYVPYYDSSVKHSDRKSVMTDADMNNGANLFVMMFNPTCSHCQDQTITFEKAADDFKRSKLLLLANMTMQEYLGDFVANTHVDKYPFMYLGTDSTDFISSLFLYQALPQINIYSADRKLIRSYTGSVPIDTLRKYIQ